VDGSLATAHAEYVLYPRVGGAVWAARWRRRTPNTYGYSLRENRGERLGMEDLAPSTF
jgi:hypothetical protein